MADNAPPSETTQIVHWLAEHPDPQTTTELIHVLDATGSHDSRRIGSRIAALQALSSRKDPQAAVALSQVFIRARLGELPEDPDLFEQALRGLVELDETSIQQGILEGMLPWLGQSAHTQIMSQWSEPLALSSATQDRMNEWLGAPSAALQRELAPLIQTTLQEFGPQWVRSFSTQGGSTWSPLVQRAQAHIVLFWLQNDAPDVVAAAAQIALGLSPNWPELKATVAQRLETIPPHPSWTKARLSLEAADSGLPQPQPWPSIGAPSTLPGQHPGLEYAPPDSTRPVPVATGPHRPIQQHALLLGSAFGFCIVCLGCGIRWKQPWIQRSAAIGLGLGTLLVLEGLLRVFNPFNSAPALFQFHGFTAPSLESRVRDDQQWLETSGGSMRHQVFSPTFDGHRIAVLGASSVHGSHYLAEEAFPAQLEEKLRQALPTEPVEVLNFGIGGTISDGIRATGIMALDLDVDLLVVYYGHNEVGRFTHLERFADLNTASLSTQIALSRTAMGRILLAWLTSSESEGVSGAGPAEFSGAPPERASLDRLKWMAEQNYRWNIALLLEEAGRRGIPVVLCQVATNYRFAHLHPITANGPGDASDLAQLIEAAETASRKGQHQEARGHWQQAIDRSASPREVSSGIQQATKELAEEYDTTLVDIQKHFYEGSPDGLTVSGLFWDNIHPTVLGHSKIAEVLSGPVQTLLAHH